LTQVIPILQLLGHNQHSEDLPFQIDGHFSEGSSGQDQSRTLHNTPDKAVALEDPPTPLATRESGAYNHTLAAPSLQSHWTPNASNVRPEPDDQCDNPTLAFS